MNKSLQVEDFNHIRVVTHMQSDIKNNLSYFMVKKSDLLTNTYKQTLHQVDMNTKSVKILDIDGAPESFVIADDKMLLIYKGEGLSRIVSFDPISQNIERVCSVQYDIQDSHYYQGSLIFKAVLNQRGNHGEDFYKQLGKQELGQLYRVDLSTGLVEPMTSNDIDVDCLSMDMDSQCIIYTGFKVKPIKPLASDVYTFDLRTSETKRWTHGDYRINHVGGLGRQGIFMGIELACHSRNDNQDIYLIDFETGLITPLTLLQDKSLESLGVMGDSHYKTGHRLKIYDGCAYYVTIDRFGETLRKMCPKGNEDIMVSPLKTIDTFTVCDDGVLVAGMTSDQLHEVYWLTDENCVQLTTLNEWSKEIQKNSPILHKGKFDGWVIPPLNRIKDKTYPGVLMIHGGPKATYSDIYSHDMQLLSQAGFYVFYCNPRGSDGRGDEFANIRGHYGDWAYEDLLDWTDQVLRNYPDLDPNRLGVMGGSYGGYMTNYVISHSNRFKAAVSARGISSMKTGFLSSDIGFEYVYEYMGNTEHPWSDPHKYDEASPLNRANQVKTPTLFMHGKEDVRCHYMESAQMYSALLYLGVETELCLFEEEGHGYEVVGKPESKLRRYRKILEWFQKYLIEECSDGIG